MILSQDILACNWTERPYRSLGSQVSMSSKYCWCIEGPGIEGPGEVTKNKKNEKNQKAKKKTHAKKKNKNKKCTCATSATHPLRSITTPPEPSPDLPHVHAGDENGQFQWHVVSAQAHRLRHINEHIIFSAIVSGGAGGVGCIAKAKNEHGDSDKWRSTKNISQ